MLKAMMISDLDQPGLEPVVDDDVITVTLEAVLVVVHDGLQPEQKHIIIMIVNDSS